ncbi:hypothetical protein HJC99_02600 [Candidatus Saccharibacteria bacterium]|nr:hypothetical protein [Candidatus Saccharibacteria bacterium]
MTTNIFSLPARCVRLTARVVTIFTVAFIIAGIAWLFLSPAIRTAPMQWYWAHFGWLLLICAAVTALTILGLAMAMLLFGGNPTDAYDGSLQIIGGAVYLTAAYMSLVGAFFLGLAVFDTVRGLAHRDFAVAVGVLIAIGGIVVFDSWYAALYRRRYKEFVAQVGEQVEAWWPATVVADDGSYIRLGLPYSAYVFYPLPDNLHKWQLAVPNQRDRKPWRTFDFGGTSTQAVVIIAAAIRTAVTQLELETKH